MVASAFLVEVPAHGIGQVLQGGYNAQIVWAVDSAEAIALAKAAAKADANGVWTAAAVTPLVAPTDWFTPHEWNFQVIVYHPSTLAEVYNVTVKSDNTNKTIDLIGPLLVTALEAVGGAALTPSYTAVGNILTVAAIADNIGTHKLVCRAWPTLADGDANNPSINSSAFFGAIVDGGIAGAVLTVTLAADGVVPTLAFYRSLKA